MRLNDRYVREIGPLLRTPRSLKGNDAMLIAWLCVHSSKPARTESTMIAVAGIGGGGTQKEH